MNNLKYHTDPDTLLKRGRAILLSSDESRFHFKVFAVNMMLSRCSNADDIGALAGVSGETVSGWIEIADKKGFDALRSENIKEGSELSAELLKMINEAKIRT